jgi:hypothetical protein
MTLPASAYRGYSAPTWDTKTIQQVLDYLQTTTLPTLDTRYAPSALAYYLETNNGNGASTIQTISNVTFTSIDVAGTVAANPGGGFNATTDLYTLPAGGIYVCQALVRIADGFGTSTNVGLGVHTSNVDGYWFQWNKYVTGGGGRCSFDYTRVASFAAGNQLRLYMFQESGGNMAITACNLSIWRIG